MRCCADAECTDVEVAPNLIELSSSVVELSTWLQAVSAAGSLVDTLSSTGPFTVFAPSNDAFAVRNLLVLRIAQ